MAKSRGSVDKKQRLTKSKDSLVEHQSSHTNESPSTYTAKTNRRASIYQIAPSDFNNTKANNINKRRWNCNIPNKSSKLTPMNYGESQRMVQLEFTPNNSNISTPKTFLKTVIESLFYLSNMDDNSQCDDYVNAIASLFRVDTSAESTAPIAVHRMGPRVLGGGLQDMNNANTNLLNLRHKKFTKSTFTINLDTNSTDSTNTTNSTNMTHITHINKGARKNSTNNKLSMTSLDNCTNNNDSCETKKNIESNTNLNGDTKTNTPRRSNRPRDITKGFNVKSANIFTFDDNSHKKSLLNSSSSIVSRQSINNQNHNHNNNESKKSNQRSKFNKKTPSTPISNGSNLPQPSFKINNTLDQCLRAMSGEMVTDSNEWFLDDIEKPVYFAEKTKIKYSNTLYTYTNDEQKRFLDDLRYDMDEQDLAFLVCLNTKRLMEWNSEGRSFFTDSTTEDKFKEIIQGLDLTSWNFFVENLLFPGIMSERIPQNCNTDVTTLLINGITFEGIIDQLERMAKYESRNLLGEPVESRVGMQESYCDICNDDECGVGNVIVYCDVCNIGVHQDCYGIPYVPDDSWLCHRCTASPSSTIKCCVCPNSFGAMKQTYSQKWCHMVCALWIGDITFANPAFLEPIDTSGVAADRLKLKCSLCNVKVGACIQCMHNSCFSAMHVSCAQAAGLLVFQINKNHDHNGNVVNLETRFKGYCRLHANKALHGHSETYTKFDKKRNLETRFIISKPHNNNVTSNCDDNSSIDNDNCSPQPNNNNDRVPIVQTSFIKKDQLDCLSDQLPLFKNEQLVHDIYQYWLIKRFVRCGSPLVRGLNSINTSINASINLAHNHNEGSNAENTLATNLETTPAIVANDLETNEEDFKIQNNCSPINDDISSLSKYDQVCDDIKLAKNKLNQLNAMEFLTYFETVVFSILDMFIEMVICDDYKNDECMGKLANNLHNLRAFMIRNLATLDCKCPSYLKNVIYPLDLFDELHNFSLNCLEKLYELAPQQTALHAITRNKYKHLFMTIRNIVKRRFPIGKFKFHFINIFKEQLRNKNYTMSHDIQEDSILYETLETPVEIKQEDANVVGNEDSTVVTTKLVDMNTCNPDDENLIKTSPPMPTELVKPIRKSRKGIPEKSPSIYDQIAKGVIVESKVFDSTHGTSTAKNDSTRVGTRSRVLSPSAGLIDTSKNDNAQVPTLVKNEDKIENKIEQKITYRSVTRSSKLKVLPQELNYELTATSPELLQIDIPSNESSTRKNNSKITSVKKNKAKQSKSNTDEHHINLRTNKKVSSDSLENSDSSSRSTRSRTSSSSQHITRTDSRQHTNNNKVSYAEGDSTRKTANDSSVSKKRSNVVAELSPPRNIKRFKSVKISEVVDTNAIVESSKRELESRSFQVATKAFDKLQALHVMDMFNMVSTSGVYFSSKSPYKSVADPRTHPIILDEFSLVWAKMTGYTAYPAIVINTDSDKTKLSKYLINTNNMRQIQKFIDKKYDGDINNKKPKPINRLYIVVFLDTNRSFQVLPRKTLQPLGVDSEVDNHCLYNFYTGKSLKFLDVFNKGYKFALSMNKKNNGSN